MPKRSVSPATLPPAERRLRSALHRLLASADGFLHGSLIRVARRCGKPGCRCATDDQARHRALCLGQTRKGKSTLVHIPAHLETRVTQWVENFNRAAELIEELNGQGRARIDQAKRETAAGKTPARRPAAKSARSTKSAKPQPPRKPS